ncbi:terminase small subunit [Clostridium saccharobutylicum]|uniref:Uncharacterized protein n=1 Tax=Clostridium saccharobutylicum TaxID=169679 RepID=A0A1S8NJT7_CLOSA|nr:terminase small subunit [Clostridium saccharobutylicum]OOM16745.1 hypothetical protein CLOSAC_10390 [Clostridium saccharobutylicum]
MNIMKWRGRPPKFQNPEELEKAIAEYFEECDEMSKPYTVTGLAMTLGISVSSLREYKNAINNIDILAQLDNDIKIKLSLIVKRAYQMCEYYVEQQLLDTKSSKSAAGYIFALKNFGRDFVDKQEIINCPNKDIESLSKEEIERKLIELEN